MSDFLQDLFASSRPTSAAAASALSFRHGRA